jgi:hypothetical protein
MGAGGISASASTSIASRSGDASGSLTTPFQYNGQFIVGTGASGTTEAASNSGGGGLGGSNTLLYVGIGVIGLIALAVLVRR